MLWIHSSSDNNYFPTDNVICKNENLPAFLEVCQIRPFFIVLGNAWNFYRKKAKKKICLCTLSARNRVRIKISGHKDINYVYQSKERVPYTFRLLLKEVH